MNSGMFFILTRISISWTIKNILETSWRRNKRQNTCLYRYFLLEIRYVKKVLLKENFFDECKKSFTELWVSKTKTNTYIIHVKTKNLKKRKIKYEKLQRNQ